MIITHRFAFAGFRGISMSNLELENPNYFNLNDKMSLGENDSPDDPDDSNPPVPPSGQDKIILRNEIGGGAGVYRSMQIVDSSGTVVFDYTTSQGCGIAVDIAGMTANHVAGTPTIFTISGGPKPYFDLTRSSSSLMFYVHGSSGDTLANSNSSLRTALETTLGGTINTWNFAGVSDLKAMWQWPVGGKLNNDNGTITIIGGTCKTVSVGCR